MTTYTEAQVILSPIDFTKECHLKEGDNLTIEGIEHEVQNNYLDNIEEGSNDEVFILLWGNSPDKFKEFLAERAYGYPAPNGNWPEFKPGDYKALWRLLKLLNEEYNLEIHKTSVVTDIMVGYNPIIILPGVIAVGCQRIPFEEVEFIYNEMLKLR